MRNNDILTNISTHLTDTFEVIDDWFDEDAACMNYKPNNGGWSITEILEHISLTSHFLLILIDKGVKKALRKAQITDFSAEWDSYSFKNSGLDEIGLYQSFNWIRPEHMEPQSLKTNSEIRSLLKKQLDICLNHLLSMPNGEGILYKTTMTVNNLGKIDVYQYIYFLSKHAERHIAQMQKVKNEYLETL